MSRADEGVRNGTSVPQRGCADDPIGTEALRQPWPHPFSCESLVTTWLRAGLRLCEPAGTDVRHRVRDPAQAQHCPTESRQICGLRWGCCGECGYPFLELV